MDVNHTNVKMYHLNVFISHVHNPFLSGDTGMQYWILKLHGSEYFRVESTLRGKGDGRV